MTRHLAEHGRTIVRELGRPRSSLTLNIGASPGKYAAPAGFGWAPRPIRATLLAAAVAWQLRKLHRILGGAPLEFTQSWSTLTADERERVLVVRFVGCNDTLGGGDVRGRGSHFYAARAIIATIARILGQDAVAVAARGPNYVVTHLIGEGATLYEWDWDKFID